MTLLKNTVTEPDGTPLTGWVDITLIGNPFQAATQSEILGPAKNRRIVDGAWEIQLSAGLYEVVQRRMDGVFHSRWTGEVPDSPSPVWLADVLVEVPGTPTTVPLRGITSAVIDGTGHLQITFTDGSTVDAGLVVGEGGGAVFSVNGQTGTVVLDGDDIGDGTTKVLMTAAERDQLAGLPGELDAKAPLAGVEGFVVHDGTAGGGTRPSGYARIRWYSPPGAAHTRPGNMTGSDIWEHDA